MQLGEELDLRGDDDVALLAGLVDRGLPAFVLHPRIELNVVAQVLHDIDRELVLRCAVGDEVLGRLLVHVLELHPLVAGEMIGEPGVAALGFATDPVAHDEALVGVALALDDLVVVELAVEAAQGRGVGARRLRYGSRASADAETARCRRRGGRPRGAVR